MITRLPIHDEPWGAVEPPQEALDAIRNLIHPGQLIAIVTWPGIDYCLRRHLLDYLELPTPYFFVEFNPRRPYQFLEQFRQFAHEQNITILAMITTRYKPSNKVFTKHADLVLTAHFLDYVPGQDHIMQIDEVLP